MDKQIQFQPKVVAIEKTMSFSRITVKYFNVERQAVEEGVKLQVSNNSLPKVYTDAYDAKIKAQKELVESLKVQWKLLWSERFNDKIRAEDVSLKDYTALKVERGTIIHATRDCKAPTFKEILEQHLIENPDRFFQPDSQAGGWSKFVKTKISGNGPRKKEQSIPYADKKQGIHQPKKGGRGWLHVT